MSWQDTFLKGRWSNAFGVKGPYYDPKIGHRGTDLSVDAGAPIFAWETMTCIENGYSPIVGPFVNFSLPDGKFIGVAHVKEGTRPNVGDVLKPGDRIALAAGHGDKHGSAWTGPHFHIVLSDHKNAATGWGPLYDARPRIMAAVQPAPAPDPAPAPSATNKWVRSSSINGAPFWPQGPLMARIQRALKARNRYNGPDDGIGGGNTAKGIQLTIRQGAGYKGPINGKLGPAAALDIQEYAKKWGGYRGPLDGDPREASWTAFAIGLEKP